MSYAADVGALQQTGQAHNPGCKQPERIEEEEVKTIVEEPIKARNREKVKKPVNELGTRMTGV